MSRAPEFRLNQVSKCVVSLLLIHSQRHLARGFEKHFARRSIVVFVLCHFEKERAIYEFGNLKLHLSAGQGDQCVVIVLGQESVKRRRRFWI